MQENKYMVWMILVVGILCTGGCAPTWIERSSGPNGAKTELLADMPKVGVALSDHVGADGTHVYRWVGIPGHRYQVRLLVEGRPVQSRLTGQGVVVVQRASTPRQTDYEFTISDDVPGRVELRLQGPRHAAYDLVIRPLL